MFDRILKRTVHRKNNTGLIIFASRTYKLGEGSDDLLLIFEMEFLVSVNRNVNQVSDEGRIRLSIITLSGAEEILIR